MVEPYNAISGNIMQYNATLSKLIDEVVNVMWREEGWDCPQRSQLCQSIGGGTGSGFGTLFLLKIRDNYLI